MGGGGKEELEIVVELGNLVPRKNLVPQKVFFAFEIFTKLDSEKFLQNHLFCIVFVTYP